ncbi:hypothetical protein IJJ97_01860 [bacterium]|nr:hypothetical protein [bacterium]
MDNKDRKYSGSFSFEKEIKAKKFAEYWKGRGYEKGESQIFWISILSDVFNIQEPTNFN